MYVLPQPGVAGSDRKGGLEKEKDGPDDDQIIEQFQSDEPELDDKFCDDSQEGVYEENDCDDHNPASVVVTCDCEQGRRG